MVPLPHLIASLPVYVPGKPIEHVAREYNLNPAEIVKLASNENPLGASPRVYDALHASLRNILHMYPDGSGLALRERLAEKHGVTPEHVILGNGSAEIIEMVAKAFLDTGETAMFSQYAFAIYKTATLSTNHMVQEIPARDDFSPNLSEFLSQINKNTRVIYFANPNNPTGSLVTRSEFEAFLDCVPPHVLVVLDEAYFEYVTRLDYTDGTSYIRSKAYPNLLVVRTFSKAYGLASLRIGYGIAHPDIIRGLEKVRSPFNTNFFAQIAALAALEDTEHVTRTVELANEERAFLSDELSRRGVRFFGDGGNFLVIECPRSANEAFLALQKRGVIVRPLGNYGMDRFIRVSLGKRAENQKFLDVFFDYLATAL